MDLVGIRRGETLSEVLTGPGERSAARRTRAWPRSRARFPPPARPGWPSACAPSGREEARAVWLEAMRRPGLLVPAG